MGALDLATVGRASQVRSLITSGGELIAKGSRYLYGKFAVAGVAESGGRVFWSGGGNEAVEAAARKFATDNGMTTLEMTRAGENLTNLTQGMSWAEKAPMWQRLSSQFAKGANGTVHVFQNAGGVGVKSVWGKIEYPILQQNGANIIYHIVP